MKSRITLIVLAGLTFVYSLVEYILSFSSYNDGGYFGFDASTDCVIILLTSIILVVLTILNLVGYLNNKNYSKEINYTILFTTGFHAAYSLFSMLKIIGKSTSKLWDGKEFKLAFSDVSSYLYWFIFATAVLIYLIFHHLENKKTLSA